MARISSAILGAFLCASFTACGTATTEKCATSVGGLVQTSMGEPLAEARVCVYRDTGTVAETRTGPDGRFRVEVGGDAPVQIQVSKALAADDGESDWQVVGASASDVRPGKLDLHLVSIEVCEDRLLRFRVMTPEGPLRDARVRTYPPVRPKSPIEYFTGQPDPTDENGLTEQKYLTVSPVEVRVSRQTPWCPASIPFALPEAEGAAQVMEIRLVRERLVKGRVVDEDGRPVPLVGVMPTGSGPGHARAWGDLTGLDGSFCVGVPETWSSAAFRLGGGHPQDTSMSLSAPLVALGAEASLAPIQLVLPQAGCPEPDPEPGSRHGPEAMRVIASVLRSHYVGEKTRAVLLLQSGRIDEYGAEAESRTSLTEHIHESALQDLQRKSVRPIAPPTTLPLDIPVLLVESRWFRYLHELPLRDAWPRFRAQFPDCTGLICLSAVGFSTDGDQAVLHISSASGNLSASAYYYVLELESGVWKVVHHILTWIS